MEKTISKQDLIGVYNVMVAYNRTSGFMDFLGEKLNFFDSDPKIDNVGACPVEISELEKWIVEY